MGKRRKRGGKVHKKEIFLEGKRERKGQEQREVKKSLKGFFFLLSSSLLTVFSFELSLSYESP